MRAVHGANFLGQTEGVGDRKPASMRHDSRRRAPPPKPHSGPCARSWVCPLLGSFEAVAPVPPASAASAFLRRGTIPMRRTGPRGHDVAVLFSERSRAAYA